MSDSNKEKKPKRRPRPTYSEKKNVEIHKNESYLERAKRQKRIDRKHTSNRSKK